MPYYVDFAFPHQFAHDKPDRERRVSTVSTPNSFHNQRTAPIILSVFASPLVTSHPATSEPLLPPALLHHQNLHHPDEDVQEVQLKRNALVHWVLLDHALLGQPGMVQHFLDIV